jgi:hypothetical protein
MSSLRLETEEILFLKKKNQKNFWSSWGEATTSPKPTVSKSFLLLFFKKEVLASTCLFLFATPALADGLRASIATPLQAAEHDLSKGDYALAMKKVAQAEAVPGRSADETLTIDQVRAAIDASAKNYGAAASDYAAIIATGGLPPAQLHTMAEAEASSDYQVGDYAGAIRTIKAYLPGDPQFTPILLQAYLKTNDCAALEGAVYKNTKPAESDLQMVAYCDATAKDSAGYQRAISALVQHYPSPAYWTQLLGIEQADPAFSDRLALDFFRLKVAAGVAGTEPEYMDMTQAALQAGLPNEAAKIIDAGYTSNILGTGPDADRQSRLKALVVKRQEAAQKAAQTPDQPTLFQTGFNDVDAGNPAGLTLMANAIRSGKLTQPGQAELELGIAYREAGQEANAKAMWNAVQGGDGAAKLAKLWSYLN